MLILETVLLSWLSACLRQVQKHHRLRFLHHQWSQIRQGNFCLFSRNISNTSESFKIFCKALRGLLVFFFRQGINFNFESSTVISFESEVTEMLFFQTGLLPWELLNSLRQFVVWLLVIIHQRKVCLVYFTLLFSSALKMYSYIISKTSVQPHNFADIFWLDCMKVVQHIIEWWGCVKILPPTHTCNQTNPDFLILKAHVAQTSPPGCWSR